MFPGTFAATTPDKPAVVMAGSGASLTYRELEEGSARLARFLVEHGLKRGDGIALLADNSPRVYEVYWAAQRSGLLITVVNRHLTAPEVAYIVTDCGARVLVASAKLGELAAAVAPQVPGLELRLAYGGTVDGPLADGWDDYDAALHGVSAEPLADMLYSSGTTGRPKGIRPALPERQVDEPGDTYVAVFGRMYGFDADTVYLSPAPLYHAAPLRFTATVLAVGGTVVVMERFDPEGALAAIEKFGATHSQCSCACSSCPRTSAPATTCRR